MWGHTLEAPVNPPQESKTSQQSQTTLSLSSLNHVGTAPRWSTEEETGWTNKSGKRYTSGKNKTSRWTETRGPTNFHTFMITYCPPQRHLVVVDSRSDEGSSGCRNVNNNNEHKDWIWWICQLIKLRLNRWVYSKVYVQFSVKNAHFSTYPSNQPRIWKCFSCTKSLKYCVPRLILAILIDVSKVSHSTITQSVLT